MSPSPEISVVMGVRDGAASLAATVECILAQCDVDLELVVVDDGSTDATPRILAEIARREPRLRVLRQEAKGLTSALVRGCRAARGRYLARHDCGDHSAPHRLAAQKSVLDRAPATALVSCWTLCVGPGDEPLYLEKGTAQPDREVDLFAPGQSLGVAAGPSSHGSTLFRRDLYERVGGYREEFALGQDWDLWQRLGLVGRFQAVGEMLYVRRLSLDSLSFAFHDLQVEFGRLSLDATRRRQAALDEGPALARARELSRLAEAKRAERARSSRARGAYHVGEILRRRGDRRCRGYLRDAVLADPFFLRAWLRAMQSVLLPLPAPADDLPSWSWPASQEAGR